MRHILALLRGPGADHRAVFHDFAHGLAAVLMRRRSGRARIRAMQS
jgi:hypothetical protein